MDVDAISLRAAEIIALPDFDASELWLTFYLCGDPAKLERTLESLAGIGAVNLEDPSGCFLYPKLPVAGDPLAIVARVEEVLAIAARFKVDALSVDVDTSSDVGATSFKLLISF